MQVCFSASAQAVRRLAIVCFFGCTSLVFGGDIQLLLHETATVKRHEVRVGDICRVRADDQKMVKSISQIVVLDLEDTQQPEVLDSRFVRICTALEGYDLEDVRMLGASEVEITYESPKLVDDTDIERAATEAMRKALNAASGDVEVVLMSPFVRQLRETTRTTPDLTVQVIKPTRAPIGRTQLQVRLWKGHDILESRTATVLVSRRFDIAVTRVSMLPGHVIEESDVSFESRFLDMYVDSPRHDQVIGKSLRFSKQVGTILSLRDLAAVSAKEDAIAVKQRETVRVTATRGKVRVTLQGCEAMQQGRVGDVIRVRNPDTKATFSAIVTGRQKAEVRL